MGHSPPRTTATSGRTGPRDWRRILPPALTLLFMVAGCDQCSQCGTPPPPEVEDEPTDNQATPWTEPGPAPSLGEWCSQGAPVPDFPNRGQVMPTDGTLSFPPLDQARSFLIKRLPRFMDENFGYRLPMVWDPHGVPLPWEAVGYPDFDWQPEMDQFADILESSLAVGQPYVGYVNIAWGGKFTGCNGYQPSDWSRIDRDGNLPITEIDTDEGTELVVGLAHWSRDAYQECFIEALVEGTRAGVDHWFFDDPFVNIPSSFHPQNLDGFNQWLAERLDSDELAGELGLDLADFSYADHQCEDDSTWCPVDRLWQTFQILELEAFMEQARVEVALTAQELGRPSPLFGFNALPSAQLLQFSATVQDVGMSELPGILYQHNSHLAFYRLLAGMGTTLFPLKPPVMYLDEEGEGQRSVRFTPENRIVASEALMTSALSFVFPGRFTSAPYTNNHFEHDEFIPLLEQIEGQVRPVYWTSQHYCDQLAGMRMSQALLLWSVASEPSPAGTLLEEQYIGYFNAVGQALDRLHVPYRTQVLGDRFFTGHPDLAADDLEGVSLVVLPATRVLSAGAKELLVSFVEQGGQVVAVGRAGYSTALGSPIDDADQPPGWAALLSTDSGQRTRGKGNATTVPWPEEACRREEARWNTEEERDQHTVCPGLRDQVEAVLADQLDLASFKPVEAVFPQGVVIDPLRAADGSLVIKLHNRNFDDTSILPASGSLSVDTSLVPEGSTVSWFKVGHYAEPLSTSTEDGELLVDVPEFQDFALVRIGSPIEYRDFEFEPISWRSDQGG